MKEAQKNECLAKTLVSQIINLRARKEHTEETSRIINSPSCILRVLLEGGQEREDKKHGARVTKKGQVG